MLSQSEENYLKAIYSLEVQKEDKISTSMIAEKIQTKASSVSDMLKKLAEKDLLNYKKYQGVSLTKSGRKIAINIVRSHRIWESFLVKKLNFSWNEVHDIAEQLEHVKSETLIDRLDSYLNFPTHDPHGDPIPDKDGNINKTQYNLLNTLSIGDEATLIRVKDSSNSLLTYLDYYEISLNSLISVIHKESFDKSMLIEINNKRISLSNQITKNLFVQKIN